METKKSIMSVMALLCSTIVLGQSINESFHTIREHYRPIVNDTKDKGQELAFDSVAIKDSMTVDSAHWCITYLMGQSPHVLRQVVNLIVETIDLRCV